MAQNRYYGPKNRSGPSPDEVFERSFRKLRNKEARVYRRKPCSESTHFSANRMIFEGVIKNVSEGGIYVQTRERFTVGQEVIVAGAFDESWYEACKERIKDKTALFDALRVTSLDSVKVVIIGQDPYINAHPGKGPEAHGLCFSVRNGVPQPPSLRNIFKELQRDLGEPQPPFPVPGGSLVRWARQGVLLLNTCLTVEQGQPASHAGQGWEVLTDAVIKAVSARSQPVVFMLWGSHAQSKRALIDDSRHLVLCANHPSPLSALRPPLIHFSLSLETPWRNIAC